MAFRQAVELRRLEILNRRLHRQVEAMTRTIVATHESVVDIADVFDAVLSSRPYKKAIDFASAVEIIRAGAGSHFDPILVKAFLSCEDCLRSISASDEDAVVGEVDDEA